MKGLLQPIQPLLLYLLVCVSTSCETRNTEHDAQRIMPVASRGLSFAAQIFGYRDAQTSHSMSSAPSSLSTWQCSCFKSVLGAGKSRYLYCGLGVGLSTLALYRRCKGQDWAKNLIEQFSRRLSLKATANSKCSAHLVTAHGEQRHIESFSRQLSEKDRTLVNVGPVIDLAAEEASQRRSRESNPDDQFCVKRFLALLNTGSLGRVVLHAPTIPSTQTMLFSQLDDEQDGVLCVADRCDRLPSCSICFLEIFLQ